MAPWAFSRYASGAVGASSPLTAAGPLSLYRGCAMNDREYRVIDAAKSGISFASSLKPRSPRIAEAAERLKAALREASEADVQQLSARKLRRAPRISLDRAKTILLRKHLDPIVADGLVMFAGLPGIEQDLKLPRSKDGPDLHLKAAERVRRLAVEHEQEFISERNYTQNFLERFDVAVRDLEAAARVERGAARARYTRATAQVKERIKAVRRAFDVLDTRIREAYLDDEAELKLWARASRVPAKTGRPRKRKAAKASR